MILGFIDASLRLRQRQRLQQKIGQGLDQPLCVCSDRVADLTFQLENELRLICGAGFSACPPPSS